MNGRLNMEFEQGTYLKFRLTSKLHLGSVQIDLPEGAIVTFDGQTLKWGEQAYNVPAVRGAVAAGWLVPIEDNVSRYIPKPAGVRVRPATDVDGKERESMIIETSSDEAEVVGDYKDTMDKRRENARVAAASSSEFKATVTMDNTVTEEIEFKPVVKPQALPVTPPDAPLGGKKYAVEKDYSSDTEVARKGTSGFSKVVQSDEDGSSEGVPVARFSTPAVQKTTLSDPGKVASEISRLESGRPAKVQKIASEPPAPTPKPRLSAVTGCVEADTVEELMPDVQAPKPIAKKASSFDWDMSGHWVTRAKKALTFADKPEILRAILAVETPAVVKFIKVELAKRGIPIPA
jgi:hypothetical protein